MQRNYDIFEKFPDDCCLWQACVLGQFEASRKIHELAEHSDNEFFAIDLISRERLTFNLPPRNSRKPIGSRNTRAA